MSDDLREELLSILEQCLEAQLKAVRRLRRRETREAAPVRAARLSHVEMSYDVLKKAGASLHISVILDRIQSGYGVRVDRESLVSSLTKRVARGDRFVRTGPNTFGLRSDQD